MKPFDISLYRRKGSVGHAIKYCFSVTTPRLHIIMTVFPYPDDKLSRSDLYVWQLNHSKHAILRLGTVLPIPLPPKR